MSGPVGGADAAGPESGSAGFGSEHLPWGAVVHADGRPALAVRLGDDALDVAAAARDGLLPAWLDLPDLDGLLARRAADWGAAREAVRALVLAGDGRGERHLHPLSVVTPRLGWRVADYVDFSSAQAHVTHVGRVLRPDADPVPPAWWHGPIGYHGRASTVVVDGTPVVRPVGVRGTTPAGLADRGPSRRLDFELELGWVVGGPASVLGASVPIDAAEDHLFGLVLLDDWSARDVQMFESRPLGPFLGKSFATSVAAWVTPLEALQRAKVPRGPRPGPVPHDGLQLVGDWELDLVLEATLTTTLSRARGVPPAVLARSNADRLHWSAAQHLAHVASNGAVVRPGDLLGTGTVSGWGEDELGCLLERTRDGAEPIALPWGETRTWLEDGDEVVLRGWTADGVVRLAPVAGRVSPAQGRAAG